MSTFECTQQDINEKKASYIYMAWHKYIKISASPSLMAGLNLPTYLCRDDTRDRK
jgi:hypothetical protein